MSARERLDVLLLARGLADSRSQAQAMIRAGDVEVDGQRRDKPGMTVPRDARIELRARMPWVGRGAFKILGALEAWPIDPEGRVCLDVGASTGGFTQVMLERGAARVYAVDVGRGQLAWKLRGDERVVCMERQDIRTLEGLPQPPSLATVDVSFIALRSILPSVVALLAPGAVLVVLVKPQFELGRGRVGRGGIVRDPALRREAVATVLDAAASLDWRPRGARPSPIEGAQGNQEVLLWLGEDGSPGTPINRADALEQALGEE